jgi:hypothetical protein
MVNINGETTMGYEMNFDVNGALIEATTEETLTEPSDT